MPNRNEKQSLRFYAVTVDEVERLTGLDFFNTVAQPMQEQLESHIDLKACGLRVRIITIGAPPHAACRCEMVQRLAGAGTFGRQVRLEKTEKMDIFVNLLTPVSIRKRILPERSFN